jgi:23S rRNA (uracil1939-C5)-methyltransferase
MTTSLPAPETVEVLRIAPGGDGVGRLASGEAVFVPATARGDRVEITAFKRIQGVLMAQSHRIVEPSPDRKAPPCPWSERCGGCDFMHLGAEAQRREKLAILEDALTRIGGNPARPNRIGWMASEKPLAYRSRLRLHVDAQGNVGFLSPRTHRVVAVDGCVIAHPLLDEVLQSLSKVDAAGKKKLSFCEQIELRAAEEEPRLAVRLLARKGVKLRAEIYAPLFPSRALVVVAGSSEDAEQTQSFAVTSDVTLRIPVGSFSQVNPAINRKLVEAVVLAATRRSLKTFVDAYAGAGNFVIPLLAAGLTGEAVDVGAAGILAARGVARDLGLPFAGFTIGDAKPTLERFRKQRRTFDYVVLDPPRKGSKDILELVLASKPRAAALIGCDPVSLARDLGWLVERGATIEQLTVFDMFPETHHSETLAIVDFDGSAD